MTIICCFTRPAKRPAARSSQRPAMAGRYLRRRFCCYRRHGTRARHCQRLAEPSRPARPSPPARPPLPALKTASSHRCGYEDANDLDHPCPRALLKLAVGRCPAAAPDMCSQSTMSRMETCRRGRGSELTRRWWTSSGATLRAPKTMNADLDDTVDAWHGGQQLSFWNFPTDAVLLPIHVYHVESGKPVAASCARARRLAARRCAPVIKHLTSASARHLPNPSNWRAQAIRPAASHEMVRGQSSGFIFGWRERRRSTACDRGRRRSVRARAETGVETMRGLPASPIGQSGKAAQGVAR